MITKNTKEAPSKVPKNKPNEKETTKTQGWGLAIRVILLLIWVAAAVIVAQLIVG